MCVCVVVGGWGYVYVCAHRARVSVCVCVCALGVWFVCMYVYECFTCTQTCNKRLVHLCREVTAGSRQFKVGVRAVSNAVLMITTCGF